MAKVYYDPEQMAKGADSIEKELKKFNAARKRIELKIVNLPNKWDDASSQRFLSRFNQDAKPSMEDAANMMQKYADLLKQASKRYSNVIDNGNSKLSS